MADGQEKVVREFSSLARGRVVTVEIGPERTKYSIHASLLAQHSEYFEKALSGSWKEAEEGVIPLDDLDRETFDVFVEWMYTQKLPSSAGQWLPSQPDPTKEKEKYTKWETRHDMLRIKVCIFGDCFLAFGFKRAVQNDLVDSLVRWAIAGLSFTVPAIVYAFDHLPSNNPILRLLVDLHCCLSNEGKNSEKETLLDDISQLPACFLPKVILRYSQIVNGLDNKIMPCDYHEHASEKEKTACKTKNEPIQNTKGVVKSG